MHYKYELSIITVNYNGLEDTCSLIETIPFDELSLEVIVVDNASTNDEASVIAQRYPHVKTVRSHTNLGFAGGNNLGIRQAQGRYLYFINNDTLLYISKEHPGALLTPLVRLLNRNPDIGIVCPKIRFAAGHQPIQFAGYTPLSKITVRNKGIGYGEDDFGQYDVPHPTPYAHGAAMMVRHDAINRVGLMPECYFLYYEEYDWSVSFRRCGYAIWYEPAVTIYHKESQTTGALSPLKIYYITRNRLLFVRRNRTGLTRSLSCFYIIVISGTKDLLKYTLTGHYPLAKATLRGIIHFLRH